VKAKVANAKVAAAQKTRRAQNSMISPRKTELTSFRDLRAEAVKAKRKQEAAARALKLAKEKSLEEAASMWANNAVAISETDIEAGAENAENSDNSYGDDDADTRNAEDSEDSSDEDEDILLLQQEELPTRHCSEKSDDEDEILLLQRFSFTEHTQPAHHGKFARRIQERRQRKHQPQIYWMCGSQGMLHYFVRCEREPSHTW
jgi:hypothetical protein